MIKLPRSLQVRLLLLVLAMVTGVWLISATLIWFDARRELDELLDSHLAQAAALLVVQQGQEADADDRSIDAPILHRYAPKVAFQVFHDGRLTLRSANAPLQPMVEPGQRHENGFETAQINGVMWRVFNANGAEKDVQVYVGEQTDSRALIMWAMLRTTLWPTVAALPLLALAIWWAVYRGVAPMRRLGWALASRQPQALHPVEIPDASSEMEPMINALNGLFERIGGLLEAERRFTADAAHELRTPIAAIRAQAQVALGEADDTLRKHALENTLAGCDRATRLAEQLLTLSRLEAIAAPAMADVDLVTLTKRVLAELAPKAVGKKQVLEFEAIGSYSIQGEETLLAVLVRNLVDNAVRYSPPSGRVEVRIKREGGRVVLSVDDSGPGLSETDIARLGERFFRVPGSIESGSGLGWSIVQRIATVHRLELKVERSHELGGLVVRVIGEMSGPKVPS
ncbi:his Kinase A domain protein [Collimonas arenae]|uniref:histidine kinase n=1 Tax=Collimonas arenae TaxID=279058 RepID=A0A127QFR3_9BURK|nr:ATP-binding protein [Collimonas arenae]AMP08890.1 his Kinase A domain protein [Collimonas arenae]